MPSSPGLAANAVQKDVPNVEVGIDGENQVTADAFAVFGEQPLPAQEHLALTVLPPSRGDRWQTRTTPRSAPHKWLQPPTGPLLMSV
jgi:hypothetical protein